MINPSSGTFPAPVLALALALVLALILTTPWTSRSFEQEATIGLVYLEDVLPARLLRQCQQVSNGIQAAGLVRSRIGTLRKSGVLPASRLHGTVLHAIYKSADMQGLVASAVRERLGSVPDAHPQSCSLLVYNSEGDHISQHYDRNWYAGRTFTALLTLVNSDADGRRCSAVQTCAALGGGEECIRTRVNSLLIFEGARVKHRATALSAGEQRVVLSMVYTTDSSQWGWQRLGRWIKDASFGV